MGTYSGSDKRLQYLFGAVLAIVGSIANEYDATQTYAVDAYVIYQNILYKCTTAVSSPEPFDNTKWSAVLIVNEMASGGGGGGTTVIANPPGAATDTLNKLQVGSTIYSVSGGGGSSHNYSLNEQVVGTWVDGSTVYEKTFVFTPTAYDTDINVGSLNIDKLIKREGCFTRRATATNIQQKDIEYRTETNTYPSYGIMVEFRNNNNAQNIHINVSGYNYTEIIEIRFTIQYTKTV